MVFLHSEYDGNPVHVGVSLLGALSESRTLAEVSGWLSGDPVPTRSLFRGDASLPTPILRSPVPVANSENFALARAHIQRVLKAAKPIKSTAGKDYLMARGIPKDAIPETLLFHTGLNICTGKRWLDLGTFRLYLAPVSGKDGLILSVHRTYLTDKGRKAPVPDAKKLVGKAGYLGGAAVKLLRQTTCWASQKASRRFSLLVRFQACRYGPACQPSSCRTR